MHFINRLAFLVKLKLKYYDFRSYTIKLKLKLKLKLNIVPRHELGVILGTTQNSV